MYKALLHKEIIKTERAFWVCLALAIFFTGYAILGINRVIATHDAAHVWLIMLMKDQTFIDSIKYIPLLCGLIIGIAQMAPEMQQRRLKLTLHLPVSSLRLMLTMLLAGVAELTLIYLLMTAAIAIYYSHIIAPEMTQLVLLTSLPWFLAGYTAYLFTAAVCLEGTWRRRIVMALLGIATVYCYFMQPMPGAYNSILPAALVFTVILLLLSYVSVNRFRQGMID